MSNSLTITILFIFISTLVAIFVRRRKRDKCILDFYKDIITLEETSGKLIKGILYVENTGIELCYLEEILDETEDLETSYILYKSEFSNIQALIRFHDELTQKARKDRDKELEKTYHPPFFRRIKRKVGNILKTVRDSVLEVINVFMSYTKKATAIGPVIKEQDKYVTKMKKELIETVGTSYEPLLEKYIGHKVIFEYLKGDKIYKLSGILKDYTAEFIEFMDVHYKIKEESIPRKADLVVPRSRAVVRHFGESWEIFKKSFLRI